MSALLLGKDRQRRLRHVEHLQDTLLTMVNDPDTRPDDVEQYRLDWKLFEDERLRLEGAAPTVAWQGCYFEDDEDKCQCGAHKASGALRGSPAHSRWCTWSKP
jgi:hypothetical protein